MSTIIQYIILRGDLIKTLDWPVGAVIAQACHACTSVIHVFHDDPCTQSYLLDLDNMHKVVLETPNEETLRSLSKTLENNLICHKLWIEQPENIPTCLVLKPYSKNEVYKYIKKLNLYK
ncbi:PREDICTED: putative peptidyl-tRNA hydrolase PTRHD1 [Ceratosolen solmsi marchali]|uniref:peptidyl-tRNA hydrolase n=1 Tax=Ceratosolen solmsi marchali TaxID=326594 RepID=A0AAJ6YVZ9_9HYME|nr:PREDICTED: putative peptidyl-tRNA hydrolase PTRHD1 [Ceratosolen solmsi marchali]XP_011505371.1 PREDICTED: putative peptidyl-tRNA hydrolase PTRHD1 [Ceratosolen solmsi marchali]XP_011505372.1 PREDICTED: putative peptidyl-tRNA hydrolase PTRHD1 [Ceratosolen solmsi marchali]